MVPSTPPIPKAAPYQPSALGRSWSSKVTVMMASASGLTTATMIPASARTEIKKVALGARKARAEVMISPIRP